MTTEFQDIIVPPHEIIVANSKDELQQCFDVVSLQAISPPYPN